MPRDMVMTLIAAMILASLPFIWIIRHLGPNRRPHEEGKPDGMFMLVSCLVGIGTIIPVVSSVIEWQREQRMIASTEAVVAHMGMCVVNPRWSGRDKQYLLFCRVKPQAEGSDYVSVEAGYPSRPGGLEKWVRLHPPGTEIVLRRMPGNPNTLWGFDQLVPAATTTSASSTTVSLGFGFVSAAMLLISRLIVRRRNARLGNVHV